MQLKRSDLQPGDKDIVLKNAQMSRNLKLLLHRKDRGQNLVYPQICELSFLNWKGESTIKFKIISCFSLDIAL